MNKPTIELDKMPKSCSECNNIYTITEKNTDFRMCQTTNENVTNYWHAQRHPQCPIIVPKTMDELRDEIIEEFTKYYKHSIEQYGLKLILDKKGLYFKDNQYIVKYENGVLRLNRTYYKGWPTPKRMYLLGKYFDRLEEK